MVRDLRRFSAAACQPALSRHERRENGVYYTPPEIVRLIVELTLRPLLASRGAPPRVLDPACGAGEFLLEALRQCTAKHEPAAAGRCIAGVDIDPAAVHSARQRLGEIGLRFPARNIAVGNALTANLFPAASFDAIVGNPPYVNIRQLCKSLPRERIDNLRRRFATARGNFDLYVLFIERALELLRPGGRCGLIVPNKWATLDYARPCRELLLKQTTIEHVIDFAEAGAFAGASVYPQVIIFRKQPAARDHVIQVRDFRHENRQRIRQSSLSAVAFQLGTALDVEARVATRPLAEIAAIHCGTAGYMAAQTALRLIEGDEAAGADFITSGNIDRYAVRLGRVRYLRRNYTRPRLPLDIPELTVAKRRLFAEPKIVVAGMSRRLEAAWDRRGLALGVQVFAIRDFSLDPFYLLAVLNSKLLSYLFATRYAAKRLSGGYLAVNKGQLARLPICMAAFAERGDRLRADRLSALAANWISAYELEADNLVYQLYRLSAAEIARVESHFATRLAAAA
jgi:adenine-specific DNA-methyltransferase